MLTFKLSHLPDTKYWGSPVCAPLHPCKHQLQAFLPIQLGGNWTVFVFSSLKSFFTLLGHTPPWTCSGQRRCLSSSCGSGGLNSGHRGWLAGSLLSEPSCWSHCHLAQITEWELVLSVDYIICRLLVMSLLFLRGVIVFINLYDILLTKNINPLLSAFTFKYILKPFIFILCSLVVCLQVCLKMVDPWNWSYRWL